MICTNTDCYVVNYKERKEKKKIIWYWLKDVFKLVFDKL